MPIYIPKCIEVMCRVLIRMMRLDACQSASEALGDDCSYEQPHLHEDDWQISLWELFRVASWSCKCNVFEGCQGYSEACDAALVIPICTRPPGRGREQS